MKKLVALAFVALMAAPAMGAFYVAGDFNVVWDPVNPGYQMTNIIGDLWELTLSGETPGAHEFKVTDGTWSNTWPSSNSKVLVAGDGSVKITFHDTSFPNEGWLPNTERAGWQDPGLGWDIMGSFNGWASPVATMVARGGGTDIYDASFVVATPGAYEFKFRKLGDWSVSVGDGFGNGSNIPYTTTVANEVVTLALDTTNGRYSLVPEPATLALLGLGGLVMLRRRR